MSCDFVSVATPGVQRLHPYQPGKPVEELERELGITDSVKLASNENPSGPSAKAMAAAASALTEATRYPDANGYILKQALNQHFGYPVETISLGNGSNDLLEIIGRTFIQPGNEVIYSQHAFLVYALVAQVTGAKAVVTPARDWGHDLNAMAAAVTPATKVIFLANPNNPTGTWFSDAELRSFMAKIPGEVVVVLDEAYSEYVDNSEFPDSIGIQSEFSNLIVTRTFSKVYGLAALRVGYAIADPVITDLINRVRQPFNVNTPAMVAAAAVLGDIEHVEKSVRLNTEGRIALEQGFTRLGLSWIPSVGNFISFDCGRDALQIYEALLREGVIVRPVGNYQMPDHLRVTVGLPEENQRFLTALAKVIKA